MPEKLLKNEDFIRRDFFKKQISASSLLMDSKDHRGIDWEKEDEEVGGGRAPSPPIIL